MNSKKWVFAALITVAVLFLVAIVLAGVLVWQMASSLGGMEIEEVWTPQQAVEATVAPSAEIPADAQLALVLFQNGDFTDKLADSFAAACGDIGISADITVAGSGDPWEVFELCMVHMESGVSAIATNCPDPALVEKLSYTAQELGIVFVSLDTAMGVQIIPHVSLHIDGQGTPEEMAYLLLSMMAEQCGSSTEYVILSMMEEDPVLDAVEQYMNNGELGDIKCLGSAHGGGSMEACMEAAVHLLGKYDPDAIICTDPEATEAASRMIADLSLTVQVYGFGLPSTVADCMPEGMVAYYDPVGMGELTAWAMVALLDGTMPTKPGDSLRIPGGKTYGLCEWDGALTFPVELLHIRQDNVQIYAEYY